MDNDIIIRIEEKRIYPVLFFLVIFIILFLLLIIISIKFKLLGYLIYMFILLLCLLIPLYLEYIWLKNCNITFTKDKLLLNILTIKNVTKKCKPKWFYPFQYRIRGGIRSTGYTTKFAIPQKSQIKYSEITNYTFTQTGNLEIITANNKYVILQSLYGYKPWTDRQFTSEQLQYIYNELKKRVHNPL